MENAIEIVAMSGVWHARHSGPHARQIQRLFGTDTLPTPWTTEYLTRGQVADEVGKLNPDAEVR
jgi:hypothetical protein